MFIMLRTAFRVHEYDCTIRSIYPQDVAQYFIQYFQMTQTSDITAKKCLLGKEKPDSELFQTPEMTCHELKAAVLNLRPEDSVREFHYDSPTSFHDMSGLCKCTVYGEYSALYYVLFCS